MQQNHSALGEKAFGDAADTLTCVRYRSHRDALQAVESSLRDSGGISLLVGPEGSGKSTILRAFALHLASELDVIFIDGTRLKPEELLVAILEQFGKDPGDSPVDDILRQVRELITEEAHSWRSPVLIIDNADRMYPSSLQVLNNLAGAEVDARAALRFILSGRSALKKLLDAEGLSNLAQRFPGSYAMQPLSAEETVSYLHARLRAAGCDSAETVLPSGVSEKLREESGGWPGPLNRVALEAVRRAESDSPEPIRLTVSKNGEVINDYVCRDTKVLLGRSDFADLVVDDQFVSKMHAVFLLYSDALILLDLNSSNGTTVNSVMVSKTILRSDDIISLGDHRIKVRHAPRVSADMEELMKSPDTLRMKNLVDVRRERARRRVKSAPQGH